jgi:hypothetical protein
MQVVALLNVDEIHGFNKMKPLATPCKTNVEFLREFFRDQLISQGL